MKRHSCIIFLISVMLVTMVGCKKNPAEGPVEPQVTPGAILNTEANVVIGPTSITVANDALLFYQGVLQFQTNPSQQNLTTCRQLWINTTNDYEQSAATLFGPDGSLGADPASLINSYPIDTSGINKIVNSSVTFTQSFIDSLPTPVVGLHGIEYELYGINGSKTASQFTPQQLSYIVSVSLEIATLTAGADSGWMPGSGSYNYQFVNAGNGSMVYPDQRAAYSDLIMAIANICETDAIYKLNGPFANNNSYLQESPYASTSLQDIKNNLIGVQNVYLGKYDNQTGIGLTALVSKYNPALDKEIKEDISNAIKALNAITVPLSQAIVSQPAQIRNAMSMCDVLDDALKNDLQMYVDKYAN